MFGRVVWDKIFVIFCTFFEIHVGKKVCGNVCKCFWNVKIIAQIGIPNGPKSSKNTSIRVLMTSQS